MKTTIIKIILMNYISIFMASNLNATEGSTVNLNHPQEILPASERTTVGQDMERLFSIAASYSTDSSPEYTYFGDKIIQLLERSNVNPDELNLIKQQYHQYQEEGVLDLVAINWMSIQAAMALTPVKDRLNPGPDLSGDIPRLIKQLTKEYKGIEVWKHSADDATIEGNSIIKSLNSINYYFYLMPVISQDVNDKAVFSKIDFLEGFAGKKSPNGNGQRIRIYLYSLVGQNGSVHGGLYKTPIEIALHDLAHLSQQISSSGRFNRELETDFNSYSGVLASVLAALPETHFNRDEMNFVFTILFYALHEVLDPIAQRFEKYNWRSIRADYLDKDYSFDYVAATPAEKFWKRASKIGK